jgi:hypothetical protein
VRHIDKLAFGTVRSHRTDASWDFNTTFPRSTGPFSGDPTVNGSGHLTFPRDTPTPPASPSKREGGLRRHIKSVSFGQSVRQRPSLEDLKPDPPV